MTRVHVSFETADLGVSTRFYTELFGVGPDKQRDDYARFQPEGVPVCLSLVPGTPKVGASHFGIKLGSTAEVTDVRARLQRAGIAGAVEEATTCCYAVQDKVWASDPDGRAWEVYTVTDELGATLKSDTGACCATEQPARAGCCA
jgi:catechol 2,3-dioxygenase-like lactoylglutathione lyase family enzyme